MPTDPSERPIDRRRFFREGLRELLRPLAGAITPLENVLRQFEDKTPPPTQPPSPQQLRRYPLGVWLRPPGALAESAFRETCSRCGECVRVCPVHAIQLDATGAKGVGVPFIEADSAACAVCTSLACMNSCPSGALVPIPLADIDMGTAVWHADSCVRMSGQDCTVCVDKCPLGSAAITLTRGEITVNPHGCIGCGVCQQECPTNPKSITVIPIAMRQR